MGRDVAVDVQRWFAVPASTTPTSGAGHRAGFADTAPARPAAPHLRMHGARHRSGKAIMVTDKTAAPGRSEEEVTVVRRACALCVAIALAAGAGCGSDTARPATPPLEPARTFQLDPPPESSMIAFSEPDLVNPLRGQFQNGSVGLFPQANPAQREYPAWPGTTDMSDRIEWRTLQPRDPRTLPSDAPDDQKYDFSALDRAIDAADKQGRRFGFRVTAFNSCCSSSYPNNVNISVPDWLLSVQGATQAFLHDGVTHVIPDWNNAAYLSYFSDLLAALGRRYDQDERVAIVEMSGYGDFSENHVAFMRDTLDIPGPTEDDSQQLLGYSSRYQDQYITKASIQTLVAANLAAFPNTQLITTAGNPEIIKQLFRDSPLLSNRSKPVGIRADGLGSQSPIPAWAEDPLSWYVENDDPILKVLTERFRTAPIVTEWIPDVPSDVGSYYQQGLCDVVDDHVSMLASTGFPGQRFATTMPPDQFDLWSNANKFSGYRYAVVNTSEQQTIPSRMNFPLSLRWTNFGSAPTYEDWRPEYDILSTSGEVVQTLHGSIDLHGLVGNRRSAGNDCVPFPKSVADTVTVGDGLPPGKYSIRVRVTWNEHKPNATRTVNFPPMQLAQSGRDADGGYPLGSFTVS